MNTTGVVDASYVFSPTQRRLVTQLARRRMFLFFFGLVVASALVPPYTGNPRALAALSVVVVASLAGIIVIVAAWRRQSLKDLALQHNIVLVLVLVIGGSLLIHFAFPVFVFMVLLLLNRFL